MGFWFRVVAAFVVVAALGIYASFAFALILLKWVDPWTTAVQIERHVEAIVQGRPYHNQYRFVALRQISPALQHAIVAAEDERFREHSGIDWIELKKVMESDLQRGKMSRGASTISQQLVKNLFLSTQRSVSRKALEFAIVPLAEGILGKDRILELYLNVIEWGPGIYGAEAASQAYYHVAAARLNRDQAARMAACVPAPLKRRPAMMTNYADLILIRMRQMGW